MSWYRMKRGWKDHEFFSDEPYSERDAWQWMIEEAHWKPGMVSVMGKPITLNRGQFTASVRFMADKFQWSKDRVKRFLKRCVSWAMIESETATGQYIITICNYEKYQDRKDAPKDSIEDTTKDGVKDAPKDKQEEDKEVKKVKKRKSVRATRPENVSENIWNDFIGQRNKPFTETALRGFEREVAKAGITLEAGIQKAAERGWQSFEAEWVSKENKNGKHTKQQSADAITAEIAAEYYIPEQPEDGFNQDAGFPKLQHFQ